MAVGGSLLSEAPADEVVDEDECEDDDHLVCGCRPQLTICGRYDPDMDAVTYLEHQPNDCAACWQVWQSTGCGSCGCCSSWSCEPCKRRYQEYLRSAAD